VRGSGYEMPKIDPGLNTWLNTTPSGHRVWVRFSDHGSAAGELCTLSDRAIARRLRLGIPLDTPDRQPVAPEYLEMLRRAGAKIYRVSRWLNAVSIEYDPATIDRITDLPMVRRIQPVARFAVRPGDILDVPSETRESNGPTVEAASLSYGGSLAQIQQIAADLAHNRGYAGAGALVAMFDSGFRKDHVAFAPAYADGRVLAEWDFVFNDGNVQNEAGDVSSQHNHGTSTWSTLGGNYPGQLYGPAYEASFILAKTEDLRSETPVEEDNWLAAVEWADSLGADVISSSLSYSDWYTYSDYDGKTALVTQAANLATSLGIVVCNSAGNAGPAGGSIGAPADAFGILTVGSVTSTGLISTFSSRGPTADGRIKPEVCARGSSDWVATAASTTSLGSSSGTSFSCPLVGGCAAILIGAHPTWSPLMVREALMQTADNAATPNNTYGWGIVNVDAALDYAGQVAAFEAAAPDTVLSNTPVPLYVTATSLSTIAAAESFLYYRVDSGSYASVPLNAAGGDSLYGEIPAPAAYFSTLEYYFVVKDTVGFTGRAPADAGRTNSLVWQTIRSGDLNGDFDITVADILSLVGYVFKSSVPPEPIIVGDVDGLTGITSADIIYLVNFVFKSGPAPTLPS